VNGAIISMASLKIKEFIDYAGIKVSALLLPLLK
jgi:hypothetical protein